MNEIKELKIGKNFRIVRNDERNLSLEEFCKIKNPRAKEGEPKEREGWIHQGYFSNLPDACQKLLSCKIPASDSDNIKDLIEEFKDTVSEIKKATSAIKIENFEKPEDNRGRKSKKVKEDE